MENISKALIMAGGILIAVMIIGALAYMWTSSSEMFKQDETLELAEQTKAFNNEYEGYNKTLLRGADVISAINRAESNNRKYAGRIISESAIKQTEMEEPEYYINVTFKMITTTVYTTHGGSRTFTFQANRLYGMKEFYDVIQKNSEAFTDFKRRIFDCVKVQYNTKTGRINYLEFKEREEEDDANDYEFGM